MSLTTICFDFFGTLVKYSPSDKSQGYPDSDAVLRSAGLNGTYDAWLQQWDATYADFHERSHKDLAEFSMTNVVTAFVARVGLPANSSLVAAFEATYLREWNAGVTDIPGLRSILVGLADDYQLGVVSNTNDLTLVPDHLARLGLAHLFDDVVLSVDVGYRKPHPAIYRTALERLGSEPGRTLFIGDTFEADYEGPKQAGMRTLLITDSHHHVPAADRLTSVLDLPAVLTRRDG